LLRSLTNFAQTIERRKREYPNRPLIRISSTFFWHLSSDYLLAPNLALTTRARALDAGKEGEAMYEPVKVGTQVQKYVTPLTKADVF
jgi:hypothetical protein